MHTIKKRYLNRVIPDGGLVVAFHDFVEAETAVVRAKTGALSYRYSRSASVSVNQICVRVSHMCCLCLKGQVPLASVQP